MYCIGSANRTTALCYTGSALYTLDLGRMEIVGTIDVRGDDYYLRVYDIKEQKFVYIAAEQFGDFRLTELERIRYNVD